VLPIWVMRKTGIYTVYIYIYIYSWVALLFEQILLVNSTSLFPEIKKVGMGPLVTDLEVS